jgi:hypothetical protein
MLNVKNIADVTNYILASCKFEYERLDECTETIGSNERPVF